MATDPLTAKRTILIDGLSNALKSKSDSKKLHSALCRIRRQAFSNHEHDVNAYTFTPRAPLITPRAPLSDDSENYRPDSRSGGGSRSSSLGPLTTPRGGSVQLDLESTYLNALYYSLAAYSDTIG